MHYYYLTGRQIIIKMRHFKNEDRETNFNHPGRLLRDFQHHLKARHHRECIGDDDYFSKVYHTGAPKTLVLNLNAPSFADGIIDD